MSTTLTSSSGSTLISTGTATTITLPTYSGSTITLSCGICGTNPCSCSSGTISIGTGTGTWSTTGYVSMAPYYNMTIGTFAIDYNDTEKSLTIKGEEGVCVEFKDGTILLGGKNIYQLIFDMIKMTQGDENILQWLTDADKHKRAVAKEIGKHRKPVKKPAKKKTPRKKSKPKKK